MINRIHQTKLKIPLYGGFISCIIANLLLVSITDVGVLGYTLLLLSICFEALGASVLNTLRESLVALHADPEESSGILALLQMTVMLVSVPFGYIGGVLSDISRVLPFVLGIGLLLAGILATAVFYRTQKEGAVAP